MIEVTKNYKVTLTEEQARQLYVMLGSDGDRLAFGTRFGELRTLHGELKALFDSGIR